MVIVHDLVKQNFRAQTTEQTTAVQSWALHSRFNIYRQIEQLPKNQRMRLHLLSLDFVLQHSGQDDSRNGKYANLPAHKEYCACPLQTTVLSRNTWLLSFIMKVRKPPLNV
jgi:hypothetical protein